MELHQTSVLMQGKKKKRPDPHGEENKAQYKIEFQTVCGCVAAQLFSRCRFEAGEVKATS